MKFYIKKTDEIIGNLPWSAGEQNQSPEIPSVQRQIFPQHFLVINFHWYIALKAHDKRLFQLFESD